MTPWGKDLLASLAKVGYVSIQVDARQDRLDLYLAPADLASSDLHFAAEAVLAGSNLIADRPRVFAACPPVLVVRNVRPQPAVEAPPVQPPRKPIASSIPKGSPSLN